MDLVQWILPILSGVLMMSSGVFTQDSLYTDSDPVVQLTTEDFRTTIQGSRVAWAVEFYSTWCGHCQRFAPVWVNFAESIRGWGSEVRVAAVACSDPKNSPICRHNNIWAYPTVKFFPKNASKYHKGNPYKGDMSEQGLRNAVLDYITASRDKPRMSLEQLQSLDGVGSLRKPSTNSLFLIAVDDSPENKYLAQAAVLDLSSYYPQVMIVWSTSNVLKPHGVTDFPAVYRISHNDELEKIESKGEIVSIIARETLRSSSSVPTFTRDEVIEQTTSLPSTQSPSSTPAYIPPDGLHEQDLESTVYYSLWVEVSAQKQMSREKLKALKTYVNVLYNYLPGSNQKLVRFLRRVYNWLRTVKPNLSGKEWLAGITNLQTKRAYVPERTIWTGCKGTTNRYRGYPCGLWMTFHALTVNAYLEEDKGRDNRTSAVLQAMVGYIKHFFGCRHCAAHFAALAADVGKDHMARESDGVLWLWSAHNKVNHRLHGDVTEDPRHLKIQFPSPKICSECRFSAGGKFNPSVKWDDMQILAYLVSFYGAENIIRDLTPSTFIQPTAEPTCKTNSSLWTSCTKTCGTGVSTRVSNANPECEMRLEFRLCQIRPCNIRIKGQGNSNSSNCADNRRATVQTAKKTRIIYRDCRSSAPHIWRYCGTCANKCCRPESEKTVSISMMCKQGGRWFNTTAKVMKINHCRCDNRC